MSLVGHFSSQLQNLVNFRLLNAALLAQLLFDFFLQLVHVLHDDADDVLFFKQVLYQRLLAVFSEALPASKPAFLLNQSLRYLNHREHRHIFFYVIHARLDRLQLARTRASL